MPTPNDAARQAKGMTREEFRQRAEELSSSIGKAIQAHMADRDGEDAFVVLEALCRVHRHTVQHLPSDAISIAAFAMARYAGDLTHMAVESSKTGGAAVAH